LPVGTLTGHFNALRGINEYEKCDVAIVVGREQPNETDIENITRAFIAEDEEQLTRAKYTKVPRCRRMRNGRLDGAWQMVEVHPDRRCQTVLEMIREAEIVQAIDRVRPIFNERRVILLTSVVADLTCDRVLRWKDLTKNGTRFERGWDREGFMPCAAKQAVWVFPDLWKTERSFELDRSENCSGFSSKYLLGKAEQLFFTQSGAYGVYQYRLENARGPMSTAVVDLTRHTDPQTAIEAFLGKRLTVCSHIGGSKPIEVVVQSEPTKANIAWIRFGVEQPEEWDRPTPELTWVQMVQAQLERMADGYFVDGNLPRYFWAIGEMERECGMPESYKTA
jgi:hypothetical protein